MDRRQFLASTSVACAAGGSALLPQLTHAAEARLPLLRFDDALQRFVRAEGQARDAAGDPLRLHLHGLHRASASALERLDLHALFADPHRLTGDPVHRRHVWADSGRPADESRALSMLIPAGFLGLEIALSRNSVCSRSSCLRPGLFGGLAHGRYLLALDAWAPSSLAFSGDWRQPLGGTPGFDYFSLSVEPEDALPVAPARSASASSVA